jgi:cyclin B
MAVQAALQPLVQPAASRGGLRDITNVQVPADAKKAPPAPAVRSADECRITGCGATTAPEVDEVQEVIEYADDIFELVKRTEAPSAEPNYLDQSAEINSRMRGILVDWIIEVHQKFKLMAETLFLSVYLLDRYLKVRPDVPRARLQLVGVTCMFVACKYEEVSPPEIRDFVVVTDQACSREQILEAEVDILNTLEWRICVPTALSFAKRHCKLLNVGESQFYLIMYFLELALPDVRFLEYKPSMVSCAAVVLSNKVLKISPSFPCVVKNEHTYGDAEVKDCARKIVDALSTGQGIKAVKNKYKKAEYKSVADLIA